MYKPGGTKGTPSAELSICNSLAIHIHFTPDSGIGNPVFAECPGGSSRESSVPIQVLDLEFRRDVPVEAVDDQFAHDVDLVDAGQAVGVVAQAEADGP